MADLPRFGEARQAGAKAKFLLLQNADAPSLLASARAALERLRAAHPQLAPLLTKRGAKLLDENALDFERATLDAEQRKKHDGRVNAFVRTLAPCCASRDGLAVLEALVQTSDATSCAGDALLRALAPHCHASPAAKIAFKAAATASHDSLAQRWRWARDISTETQNVGFAAHCAADTALAEDLADSTIARRKFFQLKLRHISRHYVQSWSSRNCHSQQAAHYVLEALRKLDQQERTDATFASAAACPDCAEAAATSGQEDALCQTHLAEAMGF